MEDGDDDVSDFMCDSGYQKVGDSVAVFSRPSQAKLRKTPVEPV